MWQWVTVKLIHVLTQLHSVWYEHQWIQDLTTEYLFFTFEKTNNISIYNITVLIYKIIPITSKIIIEGKVDAEL